MMEEFRVTRPQFPVGEMLQVSWEGFSRSFAPLFFSHLIFSFINSFIGPFLNGPMWYGLCLQGLRTARGKEAKFETFFEGFKNFVPTLLLGLLVMAACVAGFLLFFIPTLALGYLAVMRQDQPMFVVCVTLGLALSMLPTVVVIFLYAPSVLFMHEQSLGVMASLEASQKMVWGNLSQWLRLYAALAALHMLGLLLCCVGLLVTTPWMIVLLAEGYRREQEALASRPPGLLA